MVFLAEAFFSGCISKLVNDGTDYSKSTIQDAICDKKNQDFSTKIYRVIEKALNTSTYDKYKNRDILYDAAEKLFLNFKENGDSIEAVKACLSGFIPDVDNIICEKFMEKFYDGICQDDYLYKRVNLILEETGIKYNQDEFSYLMEIIKKNHEEDIRNIAALNKNYVDNKDIREQEFKNNKKQDYIKNWNSRLFLHIDNNDRPITLADAFIMPDYIIHNKIDRIGFSDNDTLDEIIEKFLNYEKSIELLIMGDPGIGKSTITSWIANKHKNDERFVILRFRDWEYEELERGLLKAICTTLECKKGELDNKILLLEGFDEIKTLDISHEVINSFLASMKDFKNFKCIITSRPAYIRPYDFKCVLQLKKFDVLKIKKFYKKITGKKLKNTKKIESDLEVFGIPVILYMSIMSDIDISDSPSKPELYERIFAERGGIFDKFSCNGTEYDIGNQILRDPENIKKYLNFLQDIAFSMFDKIVLSIKKEECQIPALKYEEKMVDILEFPILHLFEKVVANIEFIHKSIYEYFVSEYVYACMDNVINNGGSASGLAEAFGYMFKSHYLSAEILEFLEFKLKHKTLDEKWGIVNEAFQIMLQNGMTYYTKKRCENILKCELNIFKNMLEILHCGKFKVLGSDALVYYLRYAVTYGLNLTGINLSGACLMRVKLDGQTYLREIDLRGVILIRADLSWTNLRNADLRGANLKDANLYNANLDGSIWYKDDIQKVLPQLRQADFTYIIEEDREERRKLYRKNLFLDDK